MSAERVPLAPVTQMRPAPGVKVIDIDLSFRDIWWRAQTSALHQLGVALYGQNNQVRRTYRGFLAPSITSGIDGWNPSGPKDGYTLVEVQHKRLRRRKGRVILRMTGNGVEADVAPQHISCVLYDPSLTTVVQEMLSELGAKLGVRSDLTLYRTTRPAMDDWHRLSECFGYALKFK